MNLKKLSALALVCLLTLAAVGCGSKKDDNASSDNAANSEKQSDANASTSTTSKATTTTDGSDSGSSNSDLGALGSAGDCLQTSLSYAALVLEPLGFAGGASQEELDQFEQQTEDLKAKIPAELKDDFETVANAYKAYGDELKGLDFSDLLNPDTQKKLEDASNALDSDEVKTAQDHIETYFKDKCGG